MPYITFPGSLLRSYHHPRSLCEQKNSSCVCQSCDCWFCSCNCSLECNEGCTCSCHEHILIHEPSCSKTCLSSICNCNVLPFMIELQIGIDPDYLETIKITGCSESCVKINKKCIYTSCYFVHCIHYPCSSPYNHVSESCTPDYCICTTNMPSPTNNQCMNCIGDKADCLCELMFICKTCNLKADTCSCPSPKRTQLPSYTSNSNEVIYKLVNGKYIATPHDCVGKDCMNCDYVTFLNEV
jgi:hypothetical protein